MATLAELIVKIGADATSFQRGLNEAQARLSGMQKAVDAAAPASTSLALGLAAVGAGAVAAATKGIQLAASMEQSKIAFTTMLGSAAQADKFLKDLWDFAAKTPFEFEGLQNSSRMLLAFGFQAKQVIPMMTAIGNAVSGLGGGAFEIDRVTRALGQMQAKGKVSAEEMMQLAELGIPAWDILAKKIGMDIPSAMKLAEQGGIASGTAINAFIEGLNQRFPDMMAKQSTTMLGLWSTAKDSLTGTLRVIGEEIIKTFDLKTKLTGAIEAFSNLANVLQAKGLRGALVELFPPETHGRIVLIAGAITGALAPAFLKLAGAIIRGTMLLGPWALAGAAIAGVAYLIYRNWEPISTFFKNLWAGIVNLAKKWGVEILAVTLPFIGIPLLIYKHWGEIKAFFVNLWGGVLRFFSDTLPQFPEKIAYYFGLMVGTAIRFLIDLPGNVVKWLGKAAEWVKEKSEQAKSWAINAWSGLVDSVVSFVRGLPDRIANFFRAAADSAQSVISELPEYFSQTWGRIIDFLTGLPGELWDKAKSIASGFWEGFKDGLGIRSPSYIERAFFAMVEAAQQAEMGIKSATDGLASALSTAADTMMTRLSRSMEIVDARFQLSIQAMGIMANSSQALGLKLQMLSDQMVAQAGKIETLKLAYDQMVSIKGVASDESQKLLLQLYKEQIAQTELAKSIQEVNDKMKASVGVRAQMASSGFSDVREYARYRDVENRVKAGMNVGGDSASFMENLRAKVPNYQENVNVISRIRKVDLSTAEAMLDAQLYREAIAKLPGLALGGQILSPGSVLVGERGPELLNLPRGAQVSPLDRGGVAEQTIIIHLDGREIARSTIKHMPTVIRLQGVTI